MVTASQRSRNWISPLFREPVALGVMNFGHERAVQRQSNNPQAGNAWAAPDRGLRSKRHQ